MRRLLLVMAIIACVAPTASAQLIIVGRVDRSKMVGTLQDILDADLTSGEVWHGEVYELEVVVLKVLCGEDPGETMPVRVTAHARDFEGLMITLVIDPALRMFVPRQSWWTATDVSAPVCVPEKLVAGTAYQGFVAKSFERDGERCVRL